MARCVNFARSWGYGSLVVLNLFAYRATDPKELKKAADPVGPHTDEYLALKSEATTVVAAWGAHGRLFDRDKAVLKILKRPLYVIALTGQGLPVHPLYQKSCLPKKEWVA